MHHLSCLCFISHFKNNTQPTKKNYLLCQSVIHHTATHMRYVIRINKFLLNRFYFYLKLRWVHANPLFLLFLIQIDLVFVFIHTQIKNYAHFTDFLHANPSTHHL